MRIRTVKPEFWTDSYMVSLPPLARLIFIGLWSAADDHGLIEDELERVAMQIMPREDQQEIAGWIWNFLADGKLEQAFTDHGGSFLRIVNWEKHQKVDKPSKSRIFREGSRKVAIPFSVRKSVAMKYECLEGGEKSVPCYYCAAMGKIIWWRNKSGSPSTWISFSGLELDHLDPESENGPTEPENMVLACRKCNRTKGVNAWFEHLIRISTMRIPGITANTREPSLWDQGSGIRDQGKEQGREGAELPGAFNQERGSDMAKKKTAIQEDLIPPVLMDSSEFMEAWKGFLEMRDEIKKPATEYAQKLLIKKVQTLSAGHLKDAIAILEQSVTSSWQDLYPLKNQNQNFKGFPSHNRSESERPDLDFLPTGSD